tara:strand:+ start:4355 stop:4558 length:204 start_codon:yes stop_codon:yes gene_type:complete
MIDLNLYELFQDFNKKYKIAESMKESFIRAGATEEEAEEAVNRIFKNAVKENKDLLRAFSLEQARKK